MYILHQLLSNVKSFIVLIVMGDVVDFVELFSFFSVPTVKKYADREDWSTPLKQQRCKKRPVMDAFEEIVDTWLVEHGKLKEITRIRSMHIALCNYGLDSAYNSSVDHVYNYV